MHLSALAVRRPIATSMLWLAAVLLGCVSLARLEVTLLPEIREDQIHVWIPYPDAGVPEIEEAVARPVEEALVTVRGVRGLRTEVVPGGASIHVRMQRTADPDLVALGLRERLDAVRWTLPERVGRPLLLSGGGAGRPSLVLALAASDLQAAADWAESVLRARLEQIEGVARAHVVGAPEREVQVLPDDELMRLHGVSAGQMADALQSANVETPGGVMRRRGIRYALQVESGLASGAEVADVVVARTDTRDLRVGDLGEVIDGNAPADGWSRLDGDPAVGVLVYEEAGANLVETADRVHRKLDELNAEGHEFDVAVVTDPSPFIRQSISGVWQAVWLGGLLAFAVLYAFLRDLRSPVLLFAVLPVSVLTSFAVLELFDVSLNLMSLGGVALGVGMLVDNSIICLENIHRLRARGMTAVRAAAEGAREIALPILASTLTTCAVFVPLAWVPGPVGLLFRDQAVAVCVSLLISLLTALTLLPMMSGRIAASIPPPARLPWYGLYHRLLRGSLRHRGRLFALTGAVLALALYSMWLLPREILPAVASETLELELTLPSGTDVTATDLAVQEIESWLAGRDEIRQTFVAVGSAASLDPGQTERRLDRATLRVTLRADRTGQRGQLVRALRNRFGHRSEWKIEELPSRQELAALLPAGSATLSCEISGPDPLVAEELAASLHERASRDLAREELPLQLRRAESQPRFALHFDEAAAWRQGVDETEIFQALQARSSGLEATRLRRFDEEIPVVIRPARDVHPASGSVVAAGRVFPVRDLFDVRTELAPARRVRVNQARVATIDWEGPLRQVGRVQRALGRAIDSTAEESAWPAGYTARFGGAYREMQETMGALVRAFLLSAGLVLLILAAQFESLRLPLVIFAAVPLAVIGAALALWVTGDSVNALSGIGLVVLVGIVVNDSILKVDLLRRLRDSGMGRVRSIYVASRQRYRPILMTTATTCLALVPLYFGVGAELRAPLATAVIGGLASATVLTLLVVPILFDSVLAVGPWLRRRRPHGEDAS